MLLLTRFRSIFPFNRMEEPKQRERPSCIFPKLRAPGICSFSVGMQAISSQDFAVKADQLQSSPWLQLLLQ